MNSAVFRCTRESLGLSVDWLATHLGVATRTVTRWESGVARIPKGVAEELERIEDETREIVDVLARNRRGRFPKPLETYRTDADYRDAHDRRSAEYPPELQFSAYTAAWHRAVCARVRNKVAGVPLVFSDELGVN